jgi:hypothetical protein
MAKVGKPKAKPKPSKKTQYGRFVETARKLECDESETTFERTFEKIAPPKKRGDLVAPVSGLPDLTKYPRRKTPSAS